MLSRAYRARVEARTRLRLGLAVWRSGAADNSQAGEVNALAEASKRLVSRYAK